MSSAQMAAHDEAISGIRGQPAVDSDSTEAQNVTMSEKKNASEHQHQHTEAEVQALADRLGGGDPERHLTAPMDDVEYVMDKIEAMTVDEARQILSAMLKEHEDDYNFSGHLRAQLTALLAGPAAAAAAAVPAGEKGDSGSGAVDDDWETEIKTAAALNKFFSPYPEVRAITTPDDDPAVPCETARAHLLGLAWSVIGQFTNSLFASRFPGIGLGSSVAQILLYPCGLLLARVLPDWGVTVGSGGGRTATTTRVSLNPGPWSYKEQMLATVVMNVSMGTAYCFSNIQTQAVFYRDAWLTAEYGILLLLSTQLLGLGFAGLLRRFVVYPVEALWPTVLPTVALNRALLVKERRETVHGWRLSRYQMFFVFFGGMFVYYWIPAFLFPALSTFAWMTWIAPNNFNLNIITGNGQLGFNPIPTFDWNIITYLANPLAMPFFAFAQQFGGQLLGGLIIIAIYWTNKSWTGYLPPNSSSIFDNTGNPYNISRVIDPVRAVVIEEEYQAYSPPFYTAGSLVSYGAFFLFYPLTMVFVMLDAWRPLWKAFKSMFQATRESMQSIARGTARTVGALARGNVGEAGKHLNDMFRYDGSIYDGFDDPFTQIMRQYPEVPDWWFLSIALIAFVFGIIVLARYPELEAPVWTIFFVIGINLLFLIPMTYINAISGITQGLNVVTELIIGYALPGHPEAMMFVKAYGYNINGQADNYISDQKMGFYAKVPPRAMYRGQIISTIITAFVCYAVVDFVDTTIPDICTPHQKSKFTCADGSAIFFASSVVWGAIGPQRVFAQLYPAMKYCFLLGFLLGLVWWAVKKFGAYGRDALRKTLPAVVFTPLNCVVLKPISFLKHVHPTVVVSGALNWSPSNVSYTIGGLYFSFASMYYLRRYRTAWWEKYNYVISAAMDGGVAFSAIVIFFALQWNPKSISWWGTEIVGETIDTGAGRQTLLQIPDKGYFGPDRWF